MLRTSCPALPLEPPASPYIPLSPSVEGASTRGGETEGESSTASGSQPDYGMTAAPSTAGRPTLPSGQLLTASWIFTRECLENCSWVRVVFKVRGGVEQLSFSRKLAPSATSVPAPHRHRQRGTPDCEKRRVAWIERRHHLSQSQPLRSGDETVRSTSPAPGVDPPATPPPTVSLPSKQATPPSSQATPPSSRNVAASASALSVFRLSKRRLACQHVGRHRC
jgi:hypothetical protein